MDMNTYYYFNEDENDLMHRTKVQDKIYDALNSQEMINQQFLEKILYDKIKITWTEQNQFLKHEKDLKNFKLKEKIPYFFCDGKRIFLMEYYNNKISIFSSVDKNFIKMLNENDFKNVIWSMISVSDLEYFYDIFKYRKRKKEEFEKNKNDKRTYRFILEMTMNFYLKKLEKKLSELKNQYSSFFVNRWFKKNSLNLPVNPKNIKAIINEILPISSFDCIYPEIFDYINQIQKCDKHLELLIFNNEKFPMFVELTKNTNVFNMPLYSLKSNEFFCYTIYQKKLEIFCSHDKKFVKFLKEHEETIIENLAYCDRINLLIPYLIVLQEEFNKIKWWYWNKEKKYQQIINEHPLHLIQKNFEKKYELPATQGFDSTNLELTIPMATLLHNHIEHNLKLLNECLIKFKTTHPGLFSFIWFRKNPLNLPVIFKNIKSIENELDNYLFIAEDFPLEIFDYISKLKKWGQYLKRSISCLCFEDDKVFHSANWCQDIFALKVSQNVCDAFFKHVPFFVYESINFFQFTINFSCLPEIDQLNLICILNLSNDVVPRGYLNSIFNSKSPEEFKTEFNKLQEEMPEIVASYNQRTHERLSNSINIHKFDESISLFSFAKKAKIFEENFNYDKIIEDLNAFKTKLIEFQNNDSITNFIIIENLILCAKKICDGLSENLETVKCYITTLQKENENLINEIQKLEIQISKTKARLIDLETKITKDNEKYEAMLENKKIYELTLKKSEQWEKEFQDNYIIITNDVAAQKDEIDNNEIEKQKTESNLSYFEKKLIEKKGSAEELNNLFETLNPPQLSILENFHDH